MGLETVEIVLWAEEEFRIDIPDSEARDIMTIGEFVSYLRTKALAKHGTEAQTETEIFEKLANVLEQRYGVARERIRPEVTFYKDLRLG
jgi:hypothetical protein